MENGEDAQGAHQQRSDVHACHYLPRRSLSLSVSRVHKFLCHGAEYPASSGSRLGLHAVAALCLKCRQDSASADRLADPSHRPAPIANPLAQIRPIGPAARGSETPPQTFAGARRADDPARDRPRSRGPLNASSRHRHHQPHSVHQSVLRPRARRSGGQSHGVPVLGESARGYAVLAMGMARPACEELHRPARACDAH